MSLHAPLKCQYLPLIYPHLLIPVCCVSYCCLFEGDIVTCPLHVVVAGVCILFLLLCVCIYMWLFMIVS